MDTKSDDRVFRAMAKLDQVLKNHGNLDACCDAELDVMAAMPSTMEGTVALLRFTADTLDSDGYQPFVTAIRTAADYFEGYVEAIRGGRQRGTVPVTTRTPDEGAEVKQLHAEIDRMKDLLAQRPEPVTPKERRYTCERCGGPLHALRLDAKYCSTKCRVAAHRLGRQS